MLNTFRCFGKLASGGKINETVPAAATICALLAILLGLLTLAGWISGLSLLASVRAKYIPMAPSTALCFSLIAVGLILQLTRPA